jgi:hypothetical protein
MFGTALVPASQAFASGPKPPSGKTVCSTVSGSTGTGMIQISGCVDSKGANTGTGTPSFSYLTLVAGGPVTWNSGKTTTFGSPGTPVASTGKKCPGYVKPPKGGPVPPEPAMVKFSGAVVAPDSAGFKVPGKYKGVICLSTTGIITALKPLKVS